MKKILLGLMVLSAMAYANGTTPQLPTINPTTAEATADERGTGVQIVTKANVISSGLIIATNSTDISGIDKGQIELAHTDLTPTNLADNNPIVSGTSTFYIKRVNNNERLGRKGYDLTINLDHDGKLKHEMDETAILNHSLGLVFTNDASLNITTAPSESIKKYTTKRPLTDEDYVIKGEITSTIAGSQTNAVAGNYVNDALITVTISKPTK